MRFFLIAGLGLVMFSCFEHGECSDASSNMLKVGFYNFSNRGTKSIAIDSIAVVGTDLVLFKNKNVSGVELPLNPEWRSISYKIYFGGTVANLDVQYQLKAFALAPDCVAINLYNITDATGVSINEIFFTQPNLTKNGSENLKLYF